MRKYTIQLRTELIWPGGPTQFEFEAEELPISSGCIRITNEDGVVITIVPTASVSKISHVEIPEPEPEDVEEEEESANVVPEAKPTAPPKPVPKPPAHDYDHHSHPVMLAIAAVLFIGAAILAAYAVYVTHHR